MKRLPRGYKAQIQGQRMFQTMYTAEQMREYAQRQWQGLTDEDRESFWTADQMTSKEWRRLFDAVEAKLREKNA